MIAYIKHNNNNTVLEQKTLYNDNLTFTAPGRTLQNSERLLPINGNLHC
mgnify:FL=1